jgi:hypothetical protein
MGKAKKSSVPNAPTKVPKGTPPIGIKQNPSGGNRGNNPPKGNL